MTTTRTRRAPAALAALALALAVAACSSSGRDSDAARRRVRGARVGRPGVRGSGLARCAGLARRRSPAAGGSCPTAPPEPLPAGETREVTIETDEGDIVIEVEADLGPLAAGNFVALAECGFYDGWSSTGSSRAS